MSEWWLAGIGIALAAAASAEIPIHGRLCDAGGRGVAGVPVVLQPGARTEPSAGRPANGSAVEARTGHDGSFTLRAPAAGMWEVVLRPPEAVPWRLRLEPLTGETVLPPVVLAPVAGSAGEPDPAGSWREVGGRRLYAVPGTELWRETFWRRAPDRDATGSADAAAPARPLQEVEGRVVEGRVVEGRVVEGRVVDAGTLAPLAGALVWQDRRAAAAVRSDREGRYRIPFDREGRAVLRAWTEGYRAESVRIELHGHEAPALALEPSAAVRGLVVGEDGSPVAGAEIHVDTGNYVRLVHVQDGRFELGGLDAGDTVRLSVLAEGYAPASTSVTAPGPFSKPSEVRLVLSRGRPGRGRVVDASGAPVGGARVRAVLQDSERRSLSLPPVAAGEATSDAEGWFHLPHLPAGEPDLAVEAPGFVRLEVPGVEVLPGKVPLNLGVLVMEEGVVISGRVVSPAGEGVAAAEIYFAGEHRMAAFWAKAPRTVAVSGAGGRFAIADLRRGTRHDLRFEAPGYPALLLPRVPAPASGLTAALRRGARISGRVVDEEGRGIPEALLTVAAEEPDGPRPRVTHLRSDVRPDPAGAFVIDGLEPRPVDLHVHATGFVSARRHVVLADGEQVGLEIVLERGGTVTGRVLEPDGRPALINVLAVRTAGASTPRCR